MRSFTFICTTTGSVFRTSAETIYHATAKAIAQYGHNSFRVVTK